jgi:pimeloyl-ACP methyl ester carboxylesterase
MSSRLSVHLAILAFICAGSACRSERPPQRTTGEFFTDDSVRIQYTIVGAGRGDLRAVSLDRQVQDLEQLRVALGVDRMAIIGWSGLGMETAVYAMRHPDRVTRLVQVSPVPPAARIMRESGGDARAERTNRDSLAALDGR